VIPADFDQFPLTTTAADYFVLDVSLSVFADHFGVDADFGPRFDMLSTDVAPTRLDDELDRHGLCGGGDNGQASNAERCDEGDDCGAGLAEHFLCLLRRVWMMQASPAQEVSS
jgi:hypothetical protein